MLLWNTMRVLVTVKAYPALSKKYGESVCVAGVRLDTPNPTWIRLFPVFFRDMPRVSQFGKYQEISLGVRRGASDRRPESFQPNLESIVLGRKFDAKRNWSERWTVLDGLAGATTMCELLRGARHRGQQSPSLGLIKPLDPRVEVRRNPDHDPTASPGTAVEVDLFGSERRLLEAAPFIVRYQYRCTDSECGGHDQSLIDWEPGAAGRRWLAAGSLEQAEAQMRYKFGAQICAPDRDVFFYVGNQHQYPGAFMVLGIFWPPRGSRPAPVLF